MNYAFDRRKEPQKNAHARKHARTHVHAVAHDVLRRLISGSLTGFAEGFHLFLFPLTPSAPRTPAAAVGGRQPTGAWTRRVLARSAGTNLARLTPAGPAARGPYFRAHDAAHTRTCTAVGYVRLMDVSRQAAVCVQYVIKKSCHATPVPPGRGCALVNGLSATTHTKHEHNLSCATG